MIKMEHKNRPGSIRMVEDIDVEKFKKMGWTEVKKAKSKKKAKK